jgi:hypothetical protein
MTQIFSNDYLKISQDKKTQTIFTIDFLTPNKALIHSLIKTRLIKGATYTNNYKLIKCNATSITTFKEFLEIYKTKHGTSKLKIKDASFILCHLVTQLNHLIHIESHTILGYHTENIFVLNENTFLYLGCEHIIEINSTTDNIQVSYPFSTNDFFVSPELMNIKELPSYVDYKTAYFSLACLIIYCLLSSDTFLSDNCKDPLSYLNNHPIKNTKLYWLLSRCLNEDPNKRVITLI